MIIDSLNNSVGIEGLHPLFKRAFDYLKSLDFSLLEEGRKQVEEDDIICIVSTIEGKETTPLETHREYIDIQLPVSVPETYGWKPLRELADLSASYDPEKDISFYKDVPDAYYKVSPGNFAVFFPEDAHAPGIGNGTIKKIVLKIRF